MKFLEFLQEGVNDPAIFKVIFLAGGPGSGKSFMAKKTGLQSMGFVTINSDDAFEHMMRKGGLDFKMPESEKEQRDAVRDVAKATTNKKQDLALQGRLGLVIDGTGKDFDKIQKLKGKLEKMGYDSSMLFINTDLKTALSRNAARERSVPEDMAKQLWTDVQNNIGKFQQEFGGQFHVVDNSDGADFDSQTTTAFKNIGKWAKEKPKNPIAKQWIKDQTTEVPVLKDTKPAETPAPAAQASSAPAPAASTPAPQQTSAPAATPAAAPAAPAAAPAAPQGNAADGNPRDSAQGSGVYHIKMSKKGETNLKVTTIKAQNEEEALKIVRSHGYVPLEINHRTVTQRVGESVERFSKYIIKPVATTPGIKKVSNPAGRTTDHAEWEVTGKLSSQKRTFKSKAEAQKYLDGIMNESVELDESACDFISAQQLKDLEKFGDRLLQKFNIDVEFTKHFGERMSDSRNKPCIKVAELQSLFKKIGKDKGTKIKQHADHEAVLKDLQSDLNLPFVAKPTKDGEIELVLKTIMRKKDFKSPDPEVRYEDLDVPSTEYLSESEYQGKEVTLNKPFRTPGGPKKFAVYVKNDSGNVVIVRFGDPDMEIKRDDPDRRASFRARHNCADAKDKTTPRYWSCYQWRAGSKVEEAMDNDPCWKDYEMVGTKKKNGKTVPNCVPKEAYDDVCPECNAHPCECDEGFGLVDEAGRPSQRHPLEGHPYHSKTDAQLTYIGKDAHKAAQAMRGHNTDAENKYMDQANDAATVRYWRQKNGTPAWYKKKYGLKEETVSEGWMNNVANKLMGAAPKQPKYKVGQKVKYETSPHQPGWKDGGRGVGVITDYKNGHYMINGNPVNHFEIKGVIDQGVKEEVSIPLYMQEAAYAGNIGMMELVKFYQKSTETEKKHLQDLIKKGMAKEAWKLVQDKTGVKLVGKEFHEEFVLESDYFTDAQVRKLKQQYATVHTIDPSSHTYKALIAMLDKMLVQDLPMLKKLADADIKFVSGLAKNRLNRYAKTHEEMCHEDAAAAANSVSSGGVDMNPTGVGKWDKRSKFHINHMFRRADGTKYGKGKKSTD